MMALVDLIYALAATVAMIGAVEHERLNRLIETSKQIQPGDTKIEVRELLGRPIDQWEKSGFIFKSGPPQWVYGTIVDQQGIVSGELVVPFPLSIKLRWFGAH
ncbi:MAG: hypothetical protein H0T51_18230 [Pirellulales bacterium]|nr:hypothetical protein [Pirellulales bacterium]